MIAGAAMLAATSVAYAQTATDVNPTADANPTSVAEVVITGSLIPRPNLTSISPILGVPSREIKLEGVTDTISLLNELPQNFQNSQADFSNTSNPLLSPGGVSNADLRGLGPQRTLVLINGRRLGVGDANTGNTNPAPDLNQIPLALVDRVEVLTGGASATYGSDAIAGVVNFIMKTDFEGVQMDGQVSGYNHHNGNHAAQGFLTAAGIPLPKTDQWDGRNDTFDVIVGAKAPDGKGNVEAYFTYLNVEPVTQGARDFSDCLLISSGGSVSCAGSSNSNQWQVLHTSKQFSVVGNQLLPFPQAGSVPPAHFNSSPFQYILHQDTRYTGGYFAHYDINPAVQLYSEFSYMNDRSTVQIAPSGLFKGSGVGPNGTQPINCNNPLLSGQEQGVLGCTAPMIAAGSFVDVTIGRRNIEGGPRQSFYDHSNYRAVFGVKGDFADAWHYDVYGSYYYTTFFQSNTGYLSLQGIADALDVLGTAANPVCAIGSATGCVPYNIFTQGGVTQAALNFLTKVGTAQGSNEEQIVDGVVTGDLGKYGVKSPWADDGVRVAIGAEWRRDAWKFQPDAAEQSGDLSGFGGASVPINAAIGVREVFAEVRAPIAHDLAFAHDLFIEGGYRYSDYTTGPKPSTYKVGGEWAPTEDIRFRVSYDQAIRAPNIIELFNPPTVTNTSQVGTDPCAPGKNGLASATLQQCENTGVTAAEFGNGGSTDTIVQCTAGQCSTELGGNRALQPETAKTFSVGFTVTPRFLKGFTGSLDYYDIKLTQTITTIPLAVVFNQCLNTGAATPCSFIHRSPFGDIAGTTLAGGGFIVGTDANIGANEVSGIDVQGAYRLALEDVGAEGFGALQFDLNGSYLMRDKTRLVQGIPFYDCAGLFGSVCQTVNPRWRHQFRITWETPWNVLASIQWRYIRGTRLDTNTGDPVINPGGSIPFDAFDAKLPAVNYIDLAAQWRVNSHFTLRGGINNVFDKGPPQIADSVAQTGAPNAYPTYDLLGREFFLAATATF
jgi:outer membrane receptor protein involved in Fe transport